MKIEEKIKRLTKIASIIRENETLLAEEAHLFKADILFILDSLDVSIEYLCRQIHTEKEN